jgi:hypothetical protein
VQTVLATIGGTATLSGDDISGATICGLLTASTTTLTGGFAPWGTPRPTLA